MSIAIAHEWISARAGSEKVFEAIAQTFPEADLYALTQTPGVELDLGQRCVRTSFLDSLGSFRDRRGLTLPLMPLAWRYLGRSATYDTVITSSHACAKGFRPGRASAHFCYVHAPMRYVWNPEIDRRGASVAAAPARAVLRHWDRRSADWVDSFAANSTAVALRVAETYGREAVVIHPPVDTRFYFQAPVQERSGLISLGRLVPYKGHDIAIQAAAALDEHITVVGRGPDERRLRELAATVGARHRFVVDASDVEVRHAVSAARFLVFAANEDFGIVPVEAQAAGTPVVGPRMGGLLDTVLPGLTGELADELSVDGMTRALAHALGNSYSSEACRRNAGRFGVDRFRQEIEDWISAGR